MLTLRYKVTLSYFVSQSSFYCKVNLKNRFANLAQVCSTAYVTLEAAPKSWNPGRLQSSLNRVMASDVVALYQFAGLALPRSEGPTMSIELEKVRELAGFQIGTRNAQDFKLLEAVGRHGKPVILKRGFGNDATECFNAAEYIAIQGNLDIIVRAIIAIRRIST